MEHEKDIDDDDGGGGDTAWFISSKILSYLAHNLKTESASYMNFLSLLIF